MGKGTLGKIWNILCFIALALFATKMFLGIFNLSDLVSWYAIVENCIEIIIGVVILVSAYAAVSDASRGWKITYWVFVGIVALSMIFPFILSKG